MQIKERGKKVVCIKTEYVPEKKRTYGRQVASQYRYLSTVSDDARQQLTDEEVEELQEWLDKREQKAAKSRLRVSLSLAVDYTAEAAEALEEGVAELTEEKANKLWEDMARLQKALKKAGHPRPRQQPRQPAKQAVDERQDNLFQSGDKPD